MLVATRHRTEKKEDAVGSKEQTKVRHPTLSQNIT